MKKIMMSLMALMAVFLMSACSGTDSKDTVSDGGAKDANGFEYVSQGRLMATINRRVDGTAYLMCNLTFKSNEAVDPLSFLGYKIVAENIEMGDIVVIGNVGSLSRALWERPILSDEEGLTIACGGDYYLDNGSRVMVRSTNKTVPERRE